MARTSEPEIGIAVLQVLASEPNSTASVKTLIHRIPDFVKLTDQDRVQSQTRESEEIWEQIVRNLKSHDKTEGNILAEGFADHVGRGKYKITENGIRYLKSKNLI